MKELLSTEETYVSDLSAAVGLLFFKFLILKEILNSYFSFFFVSSEVFMEPLSKRGKKDHSPSIFSTMPQIRDKNAALLSEIRGNNNNDSLLFYHFL